MNSTPTLEKEKSLLPTLHWTFVVSLMTGVSTHLMVGYDVWQQWSYLLHSVSGAGLFLVLIVYPLHHFKRTLGVRRATVLLSGWLALAGLYLLGFTGLHILIFGQTEALRWIYESHVILAYAAVILLVGHLLVHRYAPRKRQPTDQGKWFNTLDKQYLPRAVKCIVILILLVIGFSLGYQLTPVPYTTTAAVTPYEYPYGKHPFRPSQTETGDGQFIDPRRIGNSAQCGTCHKQIFDEWRSSIHSQGASDKAYVTNISLLADNKGIASTRYCEGCHAPVALLTGELTKTGDHGGIENTLANHEGVSCMSCHGIDDVVHLKGVASYTFTPAQDYLFAHSDNVFARKLHNYLIRIHPQEHRQTMARPPLRRPELCATCHVQFMDVDMNNWGWVKMQDEYSAWLASHFSGQSEHTFNRDAIQRCQDCHMPLVKGLDPSANNKEMIRSHRTLGANTAIPAINNDMEQLHLVTRFLQSDKLSITIEEPRRKDATRSSQYINEELRTQRETPYYLYLGETANIRVTVANRLVGHDFPGGTTDINQAWIYFLVVDSTNKIVFESGAIDENNIVDKHAHFFHSIPIDRKGQHVWRHDLFNMTGDTYKNTVPAGGTDIAEYSLKVPYWTKGPLTVTTVLRYRKFNQRYARWALKDKYIDLPITDMARDALMIPLRIKPELKKQL